MAKENRKTFYRSKIYTQHDIPQGPDAKGHRFGFTIHCTKKGCTVTETIEIKQPGLNPKVFDPKFQKRGWHITGESKAVCPGCQRRKRSANDNTDVMETVALPDSLQPATLLGRRFEPAAEIINASDFTCEETTMNVSTNVTTAVATATADHQPLRTSERLMLAEIYLDQHFVKVEGNTGYYRAGGSDAHGAEQSHLSLERFMQMRTEEYGEIIDMFGIAENAGKAIEATQRAMRQIEEALANIQKHRLNAEELPASCKELMDSVKTRHDQLKAGFRDHMELQISTFEAKLDSEYTQLCDKVAAEWEEIRMEADSALQAKAEALTNELIGVERTLRTMNNLKTRLPAEMLQAAE